MKPRRAGCGWHSRGPATATARCSCLASGRKWGSVLSGEIRIGLSCRDAIREFHLYRWQDGGAKDAPRKENDHAMDDIRYFVETVLAGGEDGFFALSTERR